jgi:hypothetical protein
MDIRDFTMDLFSLEGKHAIVTGGNTGLGQAFALALAKAGADVLVPSIVDDDGAHQGDDRGRGRPLRVHGGRHHRPRRTPPRSSAECVERSARSTSWSTAPASAHSPRCSSSTAEVGRDRRRQPHGRLRDEHEAAKRMIPQRSGKIINICSLFSFLGGRWSSAYAATKHGHRRPHQGVLRRARPVRHPGQRHRARLLRDRDHEDAQRPRHQPACARPHPGRALGRAARPDGRRRLPREPGLRLRQRPRPRRSTAATSSAEGAERDDRPAVPDRRRRRLAELEGRRLRPRRAVVARAGSPLRPMSRPRNGIVEHPDDDLWDSIGGSQPRGHGQVLRRPGRHRRRRPVHDPLRARLPQGRRLAGVAGDELDGRARLRAVPARRPRRLAYVTTSSGYMTHRFTGRSATPPPTTSRSSGRSTPTRGSGATTPRCSSAWNIPARCSSSCSCRATSRGT